MNPSQPIFLALFKEEIAKAIKKGKKFTDRPCWHEEKNEYGYTTIGICIHCNKEKELWENPDYTTPSGFFELKGLCEKQEWWGEFCKKHGTDNISVEHINQEEMVHTDFIITGVFCLRADIMATPLTFATAVYEFLKEKGEIE